MISQEDIVSKVRSIMNDIGEENPISLLDADSVRLDDYILSAIPESVCLCVKYSNKVCINPTSSLLFKVEDGGDGSGIVVLPDDFISLIGIKLTGWKRIVAKSYDILSGNYNAQCNPATRAGKFKPVSFYRKNEKGQNILECFPYIKDAKIELFVYESKFNADNGLNTNENSSAFIAVCYMCASLVYDIFENQQTSERMRSIALSLLSNE